MVATEQAERRTPGSMLCQYGAGDDNRFGGNLKRIDIVWIPMCRSFRLSIRFDSEMCRDLETAINAEWLCTNGLGGYASGTVAGANTRKYHGLLVVAAHPPVQRYVVLSRVEDRVIV